MQRSEVKELRTDKVAESVLERIMSPKKWFFLGNRGNFSECFNWLYALKYWRLMFWKFLSKSHNVILSDKHICLFTAKIFFWNWSKLFQKSFSPIILEVQSVRVLKHWQKVRVELSGEGAGYDVTRGYNQVKVKTAIRIRNQLPQLRTLPPLSLSEHVVKRARACWSELGRNSCAQQQPAALHDIIIIPLLSPPIIYCTKLQEICKNSKSSHDVAFNFQHCDAGLDPRIWNKKNKFPDSWNGVWITFWMSRLWDIHLICNSRAETMRQLEER